MYWLAKGRIVHRYRARHNRSLCSDAFVFDECKERVLNYGLADLHPCVVVAEECKLALGALQFERQTQGLANRLSAVRDRLGCVTHARCWPIFLFFRQHSGSCESGG